MNRALLYKELRQHGIWLGLLAALSCFVFLVIVFATGADGSSGGVFFGIRQGLSYFLTLPIFIICHLLVAMEFRRRTRLFLEGLPLPRWRMIAIKACLALILATIMAGGAVFAGAAVSGGSEAISPKFFGILLSCAISWAWFLTALFFLISFLGRYKVVILLALVFGLSWINYATAVPLRDFPPFALLARFGFERDLWPVAALQGTALMTVVLFAVAFTIGLAKEGSVAAILGETMSYREKMLLGATVAILFTTVMIWFTPQPEPFALPGAVEEEYDGVHVHLSPEDTTRPVDDDVVLAGYLARRLAEKRDWLGIPKDEFPPVYVVERKGLVNEKIDWEEVEGDRVVLMYAGYRDPGFTRDTLVAFSMSVALSVHSNRRVDKEHRWWIVCGVEGLIEMEQADETTRLAREKSAYDTIKEHDLTVEKLLGRNLYAEEAGWREADAVAWMAFRYLIETVGEEKVQTLARKTITRRVTRQDSRPVWAELFQPVARVFESTTGLSLEAFVEGAREYILARPGAEAPGAEAPGAETPETENKTEEEKP
jgi:hypothetical protein